MKEHFCSAATLSQPGFSQQKYRLEPAYSALILKWQYPLKVVSSFYHLNGYIQEFHPQKLEYITKGLSLLRPGSFKLTIWEIIWF